MIHHTLIKGPEAQPDCLYKVHQFVARAMQEAERNYIYSYDPVGNEIYIRTDYPRDFRPGVSVLQPWESMPAIEGETRYAVAGTIYLDRSPSRSGWRDPAFDAKHRAERANRHFEMDDKLTERIKSKLSTFSKVANLELDLLPSELLGKPGMGRVAMTPIHVQATLTVDNQQEAERIQREGMGRGKAFGFGVLHFARQ
jgi:hypothetical protein